MRILIATDGSPHSDMAVHTGAIIGRLLPGEYTLLCVIARETDHTQATAILNRAELILTRNRNRIQKCVRIGLPAEQILQVCKEGCFELLIIGNRLPRLHRNLIAHSAEKVIARKSCPVMIARGEACLLKRVLVCEAGREPSLIRRLSESLNSLLTTFTQLTVLHVMSQIAASPGVLGWELEADAEELIARHTIEGVLLEKDLALLQPLNLELRAKVRHGPVVENIIEEAKSEDYDLVIIGPHTQKGWEHYLLDDLTKAIIGQIDRHVLVV